MRLPIGRALLVGMLLCGGMSVWSAAVGHQAKQCLEGQSHADWAGASITERGCEITTASGETVIVPLSGPPFEAGVAATAGFVLLGTAMVARRVRVARKEVEQGRKARS